MPAARRPLSLWASALLVLAVAVGCGAEDDRGAGAPPIVTAFPPSTGDPVPVTLPPGVSLPPSFPAPDTRPSTTVTARTPVAGFGEIAYRIQGTPAQRCALLAQTDAQRARGLMNRTDLAGYDGMLFVWTANTDGSFWMKDTLIPLSIAWFAADGSLVSTADMTPCVTATCPTYPAAGPYRYALEVAEGGLGALGIGPGAVISVGGACS